MPKYKFGKDTDYSAKIVLEQIGYDFNVLCERSDDDRFDFAILVMTDVQAWFAKRGVKIEAPTAVRFVLHALENAQAKEAAAPCKNS